MTLPFVLAGPIVRRVEPRHVSVWVALSRAANVELRVWAGTQMSTGFGTVASGDSPLATGRAEARRFGAGLFVAVVTARAAAQPLAPGALHAYDLILTPTSPAGPDASLRSLRLLEDETAGNRLDGVDAAAPLHLALGYLPDRLPGFATAAPTIPGVRLAHASCRRTNAPGSDAMAYLDQLIEAEFTNPAERPQQLFLTGDQIYADDLGACLLPQLAAIGRELVGGDEGLPTGAGASTTTVDGTLHNFPAMRRMRTTRVDAHFSSTDGHNHLLTFGEFAAMYCAVWSPRVWRALATPDEVFVPINAAAADLLTDWEACHETTAKWREKAERGFNEEAQSVMVFRSLVPKAARALANVATYMIFDDHEVTDDWNLSKQWRNRVVTRPLARAVMRNGLMAYTVFQAWGNDPAKFTKPDPADDVSAADYDAQGWAKAKTGELLKTTAAAFAGAGPFPAGGSTVIDTLDVLLGFDNPDTSAHTEAKPAFHYTIDGPRHRVVVLDSRTHRKFEGEGMAPPSLLGDTLAGQFAAGPLTDGREVLVVVSPAPVLGPTFIDGLVQPLAQIILDAKAATIDKLKDDFDPCDPAGHVSGAESFDLEGWGANEVALEALLRRLAGYSRVVLLSGDVHFSSSAALDFWNKGSDTPASRIVQLTSSGARNTAPAFLRAIVRAGPFFQRALQGLPVEKLAWEGKSSIVVPDGARIGPGRRARLGRSPSFVPTSPWPEDTTIPADKPPDWRWRMQVLRDSRGSSALPVSYPPQAGVEEFNGGDPIGSYAKIAARHAGAALVRANPLRLLVFASNIGLVRFAADGDDYRLEHVLYSEGTPNSNVGAPNTLHEAKLAKTTDLPPQLVAGS